MKKNDVHKLVLAALFLALGMVLPLATGQLKEVGDTLLPMHLPILLCGFLCGKKYGFITGLILPFLRSVTFGMPPLYPNCVYMGAELAAYGFFAGFFSSLFGTKKLEKICISLVLSMFLGRIVWGAVKGLLLGLKGQSFTLLMFITGGITDALLGIIIQIIVIPPIVKLYHARKKDL